MDKLTKYTNIDLIKKTNEIVDEVNKKIGNTDLARVAITGDYNDLTVKMAVDSALSDSSINPVQNKVVAAAIKNIDIDIATNDEIDTALNLAAEGDLPTVGGSIVPIIMGGTGATTVAGARTNLGVSATSDFAAVAFSGDYNKLTNKPTIPSKTSDITNDSDFITSSALSGLVKTVNNTAPDINGNVNITTSSPTEQYVLPEATSNKLGGVKIGNNISVSSGTINLTSANVTSAIGYVPARVSDTNLTGTTTAQNLTVTGTLNIPGGQIWIE